MMKFKSAILAMSLLISTSPIFCMQPANPPVVATDKSKTLPVAPNQSPQPPIQSQPQQIGWFESFLPRTFNNVDKGIEISENLSKQLEIVTEKGVKVEVKHDLKGFTDGLSKDGVKMFADPKSIDQLNKTGVSLMKTYLTAGIGGAIALSGVILLFKTLMSEKPENDQKPDLRPLYKRILTNRYLISALLMASGVGIILKSDTIVAAVS